jgi:hypothetical protein
MHRRSALTVSEATSTSQGGDNLSVGAPATHVHSRSAVRDSSRICVIA